MKFRLGFNQLLIHPLQGRIFAKGKRIVQWFFDGIVRVSFGGVDVGNSMADRAGDTRLRGWMFDVIKMRVVECTAEERYWVVASSTPSGSLDVAVPFERNLACFADACQVGGVVERAEMVGAVSPAFVSIRMAF